MVIKNGYNGLLESRIQSFAQDQGFISIMLSVYYSSQYKQLSCNSENKGATQLYKGMKMHKKINFSFLEVRIA